MARHRKGGRNFDNFPYSQHHLMLPSHATCHTTSRHVLHRLTPSATPSHATCHAISCHVLRHLMPHATPSHATCHAASRDVLRRLTPRVTPSHATYHAVGATATVRINCCHPCLSARPCSCCGSITVIRIVPSVPPPSPSLSVSPRLSVPLQSIYRRRPCRRHHPVRPCRCDHPCRH